MFYEMRPLHARFGMSVSGIDISGPLSDACISQIKRDLHEHRLLVFRGQGRVSGQRQVEISQWFGRVESTFYKHPRSPHPDVFRVSNDESQGCTRVGRSGWHIDGSFQHTPFKVQTMHFWSVSKGGATLFAPLAEVFESLPRDQQAQWTKLWFVTDGGRAHPLVHRHPYTARPALCFHCGEPFVRTFLREIESEIETGDCGSSLPARNVESARARESAAPDVEALDWAETRAMLSSITTALEQPELVLKHEWEEGDFGIMDNLALGHLAHSDTQLAPADVGLRLLHRTTVAGEYELHRWAEPSAHSSD